MKASEKTDSKINQVVAYINALDISEEEKAALRFAISDLTKSLIKEIMQDYNNSIDSIKNQIS
jgi:uncharacterized protein (UPF0297 family)